MSRQQWLSIIGVWVMIFLYLGFPTGWDKIFALCTGLLIILISFKAFGKKFSKSQDNSSYVENNHKTF